MTHRRKWWSGWSRRCLAVCVGICLILASIPAVGQDCRIYTVIYDLRSTATDESPKDGKGDARPIVGRSLSLFHGGKVYDYLDSIGEVTVFEPGREGFMLISPSRMKTAWVPLTELQRLVEEAEERASAHCLQLAASRDSTQRRELEWTKFQLAPDFRESWDAARRQLRLSGPLCEYRVRCIVIESPQFVDTFARYADWTARLNYLLHPQAMAPAPRLRLNATLRQRRVLPIEVELTATPRQELRLSAKHSLVWSLDAKDRGMIRDFEAMLKDKNFERVSFEAFQRAAIASPSASQAMLRSAPQR